MSEQTRQIIRAYVEKCGKANVAEPAHISLHMIKHWLRPQSIVLHRQPSAQSLIVLAHALGKPENGLDFLCFYGTGGVPSRYICWDRRMAPQEGAPSLPLGPQDARQPATTRNAEL